MPSRFSFAHLCLALLIPVFTSCQGDARPRSAGPRIVGTGVTDAPEDRFPYMCSLRRNGDATHVCGAFVVDKRWVVTAAHCVDPDIFGTTGFAAELYCGIHFVNDDNPEQRYATVGGIVHEAWTGNVYEGYDIAMLKLDREVKSPVPRLNFAGNPPKRERSIGAIGWGKLNEFAFADELQITLQLRVVSHTECDAKWENVIIQKDMMICTSVDRADTCEGDSGGPLFLPNMPANRLVAGNPSSDLIYGMTSFGTDGCKTDVEDNRPAVYTSIGFFSEWIQQVINNGSVKDSQSREEQVDSSPEDSQETEQNGAAPNGRFPYMCSIRGKGSRRHVCGGTLIHSRWILTTAVCLDPSNSNSAGLTPVVYCGIDEVDSASDDQTFAGVRAILHEQWTGNAVDGSDIALIKLDRAASLALPRLDVPNNTLPVGSRLFLLGWGETPTDPLPTRLNVKSNIVLISHRTCNTLWGGILDGNTMFCAGIGENDACRGDSGGPLLQLDTPENRLISGNPGLDLVIGLVSFGGADCGSSTRPGVYTNVGNFSDWISSTIAANSHD